MEETINKLDDERIELVRTEKQTLTKTQLLADKKRIEELLAEFEKQK